MNVDKMGVPGAEPGKQKGTKVRSLMRTIQERFFLRFHMSLILTATGLFGLVASSLMLYFDIENIVIRYPLTVVCSYLAFFLFVKLWLAYIASSDALHDSHITGDVVSNLPYISGSVSGPDVDSPGFGGGGGGTGGGGGASGAFDGPAMNAQVAIVSSSPGSSASGVGDAASGILDLDDAGVILIAIGVLLAAIFGSAFYLIYIAPHVLSEAAFNFLLGTSLIRSYRKINHPDWIGSVFRDTYKPALVVLIISFGAAWVIHAHAPGLTRISDLFKQ